MFHDPSQFVQSQIQTEARRGYCERSHPLQRAHTPNNTLKSARSGIQRIASKGASRADWVFSCCLQTGMQKLILINKTITALYRTLTCEILPNCVSRITVEFARYLLHPGSSVCSSLFSHDRRTPRARALILQNAALREIQLIAIELDKVLTCRVNAPTNPLILLETHRTVHLHIFL